MPVNITINIMSNEAGGLTVFEQQVLNALSGASAAPAEVKVASTSPKTVGTPTPVKAAPANPAQKAAAAEAIGVEAVTTGGATLEEAVAQATVLVAEGKSAKVKEALATVGAKRVSELKGATITGFLEALNA